MFAQSTLEFTQVKFTDEGKTVYFHINGLGEDEEERQILLDYILQDANVQSARIFTSSEFKTRCQLYIPMEITPEYVRTLLQAKGYDFDFSTISINGEIKKNQAAEIFTSPYKQASSNFPEYKITGDKLKDAENYYLAKQKWTSENPKKYNKEMQNGTATYPIIISKKEFEEFTPEKKDKLLAEPDKYIIQQ